jgi:nucleolar complex protein 3
MYIAGICSSITSNPEKSLFKRKKNELEIDDYPRLNDLLELLKHSNFEIVECAMLSSLIIFKDICPSYRIRLEKDDVQFKKETKKKMDLEKSLLTSYKSYIDFLDKNVAIGLGDPWKKIINWNHSALFGLSAFRCQCELAKSLFHFNFRSNLLASILSRGVQQIEDINKLCFSTIDYIFKTDTNGEVSFEIVRLIGQTLATHKYEVDENFLKMIFNVKLRVHADESNQIRKQAKLSKKKRKKIADNVENSLLESEAVNTNSLKRFQLDSLNEICLIYFRVIKNKVGYDLFPVALEGMGKIAHLVNIDTMEDLVNLLLSYMPLTKSVPSSIRLHSIRCALTILSGPGKELNMDMNPFIDSLYEEIKEISAEEYECWALVIDCIVLGLIKRQETRPNVILT